VNRDYLCACFTSAVKAFVIATPRQSSHSHYATEHVAVGDAQRYGGTQYFTLHVHALLDGHWAECQNAECSQVTYICHRSTSAVIIYVQYTVNHKKRDIYF